jgi:segregation and condensation protein A
MDSLLLKTPQFQGPLELLCTLVQKEEIPICELEIHSLVLQIKELLSCLEQAAESIGFAGHLLLLKSRYLLPQDPLAVAEEPEGLNRTLMENLIEYCQFKEAARALANREEQARESYTRYKYPQGEIKKPLGIDHLSLSDLASIFEQILQKAAKGRTTIEKEEWQVADKIEWIQKQLETAKQTPFETLFPLTCSKLELIVIFLALLEMMKLGVIQVGKDAETKTILVILVYGKERN